MPVLALVRHGQSQWNLEKRFTGWDDVPLTERGRTEASRAGELLGQTGIHFDCAFTSALERAQETLRIVLEKLHGAGIPITREKALNERHYGVLQGLGRDAAARTYGKEQVDRWRQSHDIAPPDGESLDETAARVLGFFESKILPELNAGRNVLVAAHGGSLRSIVMRLDGLARDRIDDVNLETGVPLLYEIDGSGRVTSKKLLKP